MIPIGPKACGIALLNSAYPRTFIYISRRRRFHCRMVLLLPAPLLRKAELDDLTAWMDNANASWRVRIGLAHGAVTNFASEGEASNPIDPARPAKAKLDYLALGDRHRTLQIGPAVWYAGTPEPDRAGRQERGTALLVEISGPGAPFSVTPLTTGTYRWLTRTERLSDGSELADLDQRLRSEQDLSRLILRLRLEGTLPLAAHAELQRRLSLISKRRCSTLRSRSGRLDRAPDPD